MTHPLRVRQELAGYDWRRQPLDARSVILPDVLAVDGEALVWGRYLQLGGRRPSRVEVTRSLLTDFTDLATADAGAILHFARRWGVLQLCQEHRLPVSHTQPAECQLLGSQDPGFRRRMRARGDWPLSDPAELEEQSSDGKWTQRRLPGVIVGYEPLEVWRDFARAASSLLDQAARVRALQPGCWDRRLAALAQEADHWLQYSGVRPVFSWYATDPVVVVSARGRLFGAIAVLLVQAMTNVEAIGWCSGCRTHFWSDRRLDTTRRSYCSNCRARKVPQRDASAAYRARRRLGPDG